jgi:hypothetical protein
VFGTGSNTIKVGVFPTRKLLSCLQEAAGEDEVKREKEKDIVLISTGKQDMKMDFPWRLQFYTKVFVYRTTAILQYSSTLG